MMRVFLDIDIGNREAYDEHLHAYRVTAAYLRHVGSQYGLPPALENLNNEGREILEEAYKADPAWLTKAVYSPSAPKDIRAGRLVIKLLTNEAPKASENFRCLCTGEKGIGKASKKLLHYKASALILASHTAASIPSHASQKLAMAAAFDAAHRFMADLQALQGIKLVPKKRLQGTRFHRIVKGFVCQGGDVVKGDGSAGDSIFGRTFNDEKPALKLKHDAAGVLSMANSGKNTNSSQFFLTLAPAPKCDGKHVVIGRVLEGAEVLAQIDEEAATEDGTNRLDVTVADCGQL